MSFGNSPEKISQLVQEQFHHQSHANNSEFTEGRWTTEEHNQFLLGVIKFGKDWKKINENIVTRTSTQIRSHAQKYFLKLTKQQKQLKKCKSRTKGLLGQLQKQIVANFTLDDFSKETPVQFINVIKKIQGKDTVFQIKENFQQEDKSAQKENKSITAEKQKEKKQGKVKESFRNQALQNGIEDAEEQSYLMRTLKNNPNCLKQGHEFYELIDFGRQSLMKYEENETSVRKRSFALPDQYQDEEKLKQTLNSFHHQLNQKE